MGWFKILSPLINKKSDSNDSNESNESNEKVAQEIDSNIEENAEEISTEDSNSATTKGPNLDDYLPVDSSILDQSKVDLYRSRLLQKSIKDVKKEIEESMSLAESDEGSDFDKLYNSLQALLGLEVANNMLRIGKDDADMAADKLAEKLAKTRNEELKDAIMRYNNDLDVVNIAQRGSKDTDGESEGEINENTKKGFLSSLLGPLSILIGGLGKGLLDKIKLDVLKGLGKGILNSIRGLGTKLLKPISAPFLAITAAIASYKAAFNASKKLDEQVEGLESAEVLQGTMEGGGNIPVAAYDINKVRENREILKATTDRKSAEREKYGKEVPNWIKAAYNDWYKDHNKALIKSKEEELNKDRKWYQPKSKYEYWKDPRYEFDLQDFIDWYMKQSNDKLDKQSSIEGWKSSKLNLDTDIQVAAEPKITPNNSTKITPEGAGDGGEKDEGASGSKSTSAQSSSISSGTILGTITNNTINNFMNDNTEVLIDNRNFKISRI